MRIYINSNSVLVMIFYGSTSYCFKRKIGSQLWYWKCHGSIQSRIKNVTNDYAIIRHNCNFSTLLMGSACRQLFMKIYKDFLEYGKKYYQFLNKTIILAQ